jgi:peptidyl-prolyl cis-trans isomerase B (cyclophilin B)
MDVVDQICADTPVQDSNGTVAAADQPVITSITVID